MILRLFRLIIKKYGFGRQPTRINQKVILTSICPYTASEEYPTEGTSYECGGIIEHMRRLDGTAHVEWHNGCKVKVSLKYLKVVSDEEFKAILKKGFVADNPNLTFKRREMEKAKRKEEVKEDVGYCMQDKYQVGRSENLYGTIDVSTMNICREFCKSNEERWRGLREEKKSKKP